MKVVILRNILIKGQHADAGAEHDLDEALALQLIRSRLAALPKPTGRARVRRVVETAALAPPAGAETAAFAPASPATPPPASIPAA